MKKPNFISMRSPHIYARPQAIGARLFNGKGSIRRLLLNVATLAAVFACAGLLLTIIWAVQP